MNANMRMVFVYCLRHHRRSFGEKMGGCIGDQTSCCISAEKYDLCKPNENSQYCSHTPKNCSEGDCERTRTRG